jgi:predicted permease
MAVAAAGTDMRLAGWLPSMVADLRHSARRLARRPGFAAVVIGSLGVGIGVNTAVFSWIQSRVLQPIPAVARSSQFHLIEPRGETGSYPGTSWLEYRDLRPRVPSFDDVLAFRMAQLNVGRADRAERTSALLVSGNFFSALGLKPAAGRFMSAESDETTELLPDPVVVISYDYWQTRYTGAAAAIGQSLRVNDRALTIIGVAPDGFDGTMMGPTFDLFVPAALAAELFDGATDLTNRGARDYSMLGRLRSGVSRAQAQGEVDAVMRQLAHDYPETNGKLTAEVLPYWQSPRGPQRMLTSGLVLLQVVMLLVLLVVWGNTASLVLARGSARRDEIGVRVALGASRWRIVRLLLSESVLLALAGAVVGCLVALWGTQALRAVPLPTPAGMTLKFQTSVDALTLAFAMGLGLASAAAFGLAPALHLSRVSPPSLRAGVGPPQSLMRDVLMAVEVALVLVVLVVAALFLKSFNDTRALDPGFRREGVLLAAYDLRGRSRNIPAAASTAFAARLLERIRAVPGVESAAIASSVPLDIHGMPSRSFDIEGKPRPDGSDEQSLSNVVTPGYFATMKIAFRAGRDFTDLMDPSAPRQAIVNEEFVRHYLVADGPVEAALGRRLITAGRELTIVGIVKNSLYEAFGEPPRPCLYLSARDRPSPAGELHVRTREGGETLLGPAIRRAVADLDPTLPVYNVRSLTDHVETNLVFRRIPARMFAFLAPVLLVLAAVGIYAVVAYSVSERRREIGMRLALGGSPRRVVWQLAAETLRVIAAGAVAGWTIAWFIDRDVVQSAAVNVPVFAGVPALLVAVATLACWMPAQRASRIDPVAVLREE